MFEKNNSQELPEPANHAIEWITEDQKQIREIILPPLDKDGQVRINDKPNSESAVVSSNGLDKIKMRLPRVWDKPTNPKYDRELEITIQVLKDNLPTTESYDATIGQGSPTVPIRLGLKKKKTVFFTISQPKDGQKFVRAANIVLATESVEQGQLEESITHFPANATKAPPKSNLLNEGQWLIAKKIGTSFKPFNLLHMDTDTHPESFDPTQFKAGVYKIAFQSKDDQSLLDEVIVELVDLQIQKKASSKSKIARQSAKANRKR